MKHLKSFELVNSKPQIGDWVILDTTGQFGRLFDDDVVNYMKTNIGKIVGFINDSAYDIKFIKCPWTLKNLINAVGVQMPQLLHWSKNKKELEEIIDSNKYNL